MSQISWDLSTAYDFFMSLRILHEPNEWQLRGAWAAGVRSRLSAENRDFLKETYPLVLLPASFIYQLDAPKNGRTLLDALTLLPPEQRLATLMGESQDQQSAMDPELAAILDRVSAEKAFDEADIDAAYQHLRRYSFNKKKTQTLLHWWVNSREFGERILPALEEYYDVFFAEEEARIAPALEEGLAHAQQMAETVASPQALVENLAQGVRYENFPDMDELVLAPSFWATPLIVFGRIDTNRRIYLYGARPSDESLVPGEQVPDALYRALKALADPTRLRIMRYLVEQPHTPATLARNLRLRPPTVVHHLHTLRLAGLVEITFTSADKRRYAARPEAVSDAIAALNRFLATD
jgi:DNA-binding transcriptional ArsR family regulator